MLHSSLNISPIINYGVNRVNGPALAAPAYIHKQRKMAVFAFWENKKNCTCLFLVQLKYHNPYAAALVQVAVYDIISLLDVLVLHCMCNKQPTRTPSEASVVASTEPPLSNQGDN